MTDETVTNVAGTPTVDPVPSTGAASPVDIAIGALETRVAELEALVHTIATDAQAAGVSWAHGHAVLTWLEKMGARIKVAVERTL
jgi:hypothetical protein